MNKARSFGSRSFALVVEIIEAPAQLETDHRQARLLADSRGLHQLVETAEKPRCAACAERSSTIQVARSRACLAHRLGAALACLVERAADLHLHDLEPWGEQLLRGLIGLKHRLQEAGEALPGLQPQSHQGLELRQIGSQRGDQQLDRDRRLPGVAATSDIVQADDEAVDLRPHPAGDLVALLLGRGGEQRRSGGDETIGRTRNLHGADGLRHAGIDQLEPVANLAKRVDAGRGGEDGKAADPEEREQQSRANPEMPGPEVLNRPPFGLAMPSRSTEASVVSPRPLYTSRDRYGLLKLTSGAPSTVVAHHRRIMR